MQGALQLAMLEEVRVPEPPIRLSALFFEPGSAEQVAAELRSLGEVVVGVGAPLSGRQPELERRGVPPQAESPEAARLVELLGLPVFTPAEDEDEGAVEEGAYHDFPVFETNADGVFCALQGRRLPAKRHPLRNAAADRGAARRPRDRRGRRPLAPPHRGARRRRLRALRPPLRRRARQLAGRASCSRAATCRRRSEARA